MGIYQMKWDFANLFDTALPNRALDTQNID